MNGLSSSNYAEEAGSEPGSEPGNKAGDTGDAGDAGEAGADNKFEVILIWMLFIRNLPESTTFNNGNSEFSRSAKSKYMSIYIFSGT
jgi:hypothetical protein